MNFCLTGRSVQESFKGKGDIMKKKLGMLLAVVLCFCMTAVVWADAGKSQSVDYKTDYYMIVESPDGGIDMYSEANTDSPKLNDELIPNGTAIHVEGEHKDDAGKIWFYTQLHGMFGFLQENYLKPATLAEAIASELKLFGSKDVDYDITVNAKEDGSVSLYKGPGKKYGTVSGGTDIKNGEKLHISTEVDTGKDGLWGETTANGVSGWVNIDQATNTEDTPVELVPEGQKTDSSETSLTPVPQSEDVKDNADDAEKESETVENTESENTEVQGNKAAEQTDTAEVGKGGADSKEEPKPTSTVTPTPKPTNTEAPKPTSTATPTPKPTNTATPTPKPTNTATPTPEPTNTATPTPEPTNTEAPTPEPTNTTAPAEVEVTETPTPEPTNTEAPTPEPTETVAPTEEPAESVTPAEAENNGQETSSENVESSSLVKSPVIWILVIAIVIGIIVVIYLLRKKGKDNDENK